MTHFIFDTNTMIKLFRVGDKRVRVSYAMSLHKTEPRNSKPLDETLLTS